MIHNFKYSKQSYHLHNTTCDCGRPVPNDDVMMRDGYKTCPTCRAETKDIEDAMNIVLN